MLCGPWLTPDDVTYCDVADPGPLFDRFVKALGVATSLLWKATAMRYGGVCTDTVRPCAQGAAVQMLAYSTGGSRPINVMAGCGCDGGSELACGCNAHANVRLPGTPVIDVPEVLVDGVPFTGFTIVDDRWLVRSDGGSWPCCQNLGLPDTDVGTWSVRYRYGRSVPAPLLLAAEVLACELVAGWACVDGDEDCACRLPKRLTQITYEGASATVLDPFQFLDQGRFGIPEVDYAVTMYNPDRLARNGRAVSVRDYLTQPRRVRLP